MADNEAYTITPKGIWVARRMEFWKSKGITEYRRAFTLAFEESKLAPEVRPIVTDDEGRVLVF